MIFIYYFRKGGNYCVVFRTGAHGDTNVIRAEAFEVAAFAYANASFGEGVRESVAVQCGQGGANR